MKTFSLPPQLLCLLFISSCAQMRLERSVSERDLQANNKESFKRFSQARLSERIEQDKDNLAVLNCHLGKFDLGIESLRGKIKDNQNSSAIWNQLGICHYLKKEYTKSLFYLKTGLGSASKNSDLSAIRNNMGLSYLKVGNLLSAKENFEKAVELNPKAQTPRFNLVQLYLSKMMLTKAYRYANELARDYPEDIDYNYTIAQIHLLREEPKKALYYLAKVPKAYMKRDHIMYALALSHYLNKDFEKSNRTLTELSAAHPEVKSKAQILGQVLTRNRD